MKTLSVVLLVLLPVLVFSQAKVQMRTFSKNLETGAAYTAGDVVGDSNFVYFPAAGRQGIVSGAYLAADTINVANATFRLYLFSDTSYVGDTTRMKKFDDNAAFTLLAADARNVAGYIDFTLVTAGAGSTLANAYVGNINLPYATRRGVLFGVLTATGAYVPAYLGTFTLKLIFGD
jgi:hypothetical protein